MKNKLLYYQGGGYDGCYWEWNFCLWDQDGEWHDLYSSGRKGADTEAKALEILADKMLDMELVDLTDSKQFLEFQDDNNAILVLGIAQELNENYNYDLRLDCSECDCEFIADKSEGDQAVDNDTIVCGECYQMGLCDCCNEYVGDEFIRFCSSESEDKVEAGLADESCYSVCEGCYECNKEELERIKQADMLSASLSTGTPDMFSDEMRWFWGAENWTNNLN